jgi:hypothetical protein
MTQMTGSTFCEVAQDIAAIQQRRFAERAADLERGIRATAKTIRECEYTDGDSRNAYVLGALRALLEGAAGLGEYAIHPSCFDSAGTEAVKELLKALSPEGGVA